MKISVKELVIIVLCCMIVGLYSNSYGAHDVGGELIQFQQLKKIKVGDWCHNCRKLFFENKNYMFCSRYCEQQYRLRQELIKKERKELNE